MPHTLRIPLLLFIFIYVSQSNTYAQSSINYNYPAPYKTNDKIEKFGHVINDPYRWTEDINSKQTTDWLATQDELIKKYRNALYSSYTVMEREILYAILADSVSNYIQNKIGAYYFHKRYDYSGDNSPVLEYKLHINHGWAKLISTAQFLRDDKDAISINFISVSFNDSLVALGISHGGSDWNEIVIVNAITRKIIDRKIEWTKYGVGWGNGGFYYTKFDTPKDGDELSSLAISSAIFFHKIGTDPDNDIMISEKNDRLKHFYTVGGGSFLITAETKIQNGKRFGILSYAQLDSTETTVLKPFVVGLNMNPDDIDIIGETDGMFIAKSNNKTPNGCIMLYNYSKPNDGKILIEPFNQNLLEAHYRKDKLICIYNDKGNYLCYIFNNKGELIKNIQLPEGVGISGFNRTYADTLTYYYINSFAMPEVTMRLNLLTLKSELPDEYAGFALSSKYTTKVVSYKSKDSTDVYMYLTYNNEITPNENTPVLIYAYGGFGTVTAPFYDPCFGMMLSRNAIIAVPLIRGGGEFGANWHKAGQRENKQNSVDDVAWAAKWLIDNKYTSANKVAITGGSQGGWLMANAAIQYPELFKVAVPRAGVYDMLRYKLYSSLASVGIPEYGDPDDSTDFGNLLKISPVYNIKKGVKYPDMLQFIGDKDNRVVPFHTYKLTAALQEIADPANPYLVYVESNAGHSVVSSMGGISILQQMAFMYTFIMDRLGMHIK